MKTLKCILLLLVASTTTLAIAQRASFDLGRLSMTPVNGDVTPVTFRSTEWMGGIQKTILGLNYAGRTAPVAEGTALLLADRQSLYPGLGVQIPFYSGNTRALTIGVGYVARLRDNRWQRGTFGVTASIPMKF